MRHVYQCLHCKAKTRDEDVWKSPPGALASGKVTDMLFVCPTCGVSDKQCLAWEDRTLADAGILPPQPELS